MFKNLLSNKVIIVDVSFICYQGGLVYKSFSIPNDGLPFHNEGIIYKHIEGKCKGAQIGFK